MSKRSFFAGVVAGYALVMISIAIVNPDSLPNRIAASVKGKYYKKCEERFFATTAEGRIIPLQPLDVPNLDTPAVISWIAVATTRAFTFGFHDIDERLQYAKKDFTDEGWENFNTLLKDSGLLEKIPQEKLLMKAVPQAAPRLTKQGVIKVGEVRTYEWQLEVPLVVTFQSQEGVLTDGFKVAVNLQRALVVDSPSGIAISSIKKL